MTSQTVTVEQQTGQPTAAGATPTRSAGRAIVASVVVGAVTALVLDLVVFAGGTEATITGASLLGFGLGWALMAVLTVRRDEPQRWAAVPATLMGVTGVALLVLEPGEGAMTALSWVWPPLVLALAAWMFVQVRRSVSGRARWVLFPVVSALALASLGAAWQDIAVPGDKVAGGAPGTLYDVRGHRLHLDCRGHGSPTVVLSNGLGETTAEWARITTPVAGTTRVCAYDRAGQGWSESATSPQDGVESAEDLHGLLAAAGEHAPYVLVGHSTGGTMAMTYAARYPDQVAGLVLLDSSSPEQLTRLPGFPAQYAMMRRGYGLLPTLSRLGLGQLVPSSSHLPPADAAKVAALGATTQSYRSQRDEVSVLPEVFAQARALTTLGERPLAVLTASTNSDGMDGWAGAQDRLAALSTNRIHLTVDSTHTGLLEDVGPAAQSVRAITEVVSSVRTGRPLPTR